MSQHQSQPLVPFNALKPATWGSLKLLPLALRSKLTGAKGSDDINRVAFGKENAGGQPAGLQAPPKLGDLSHLQAIGPRRNVSQRYVLQPNLNVSRPAVTTHAPGLSGLLLPGMAPIATQYGKQQLSQKDNASQQQQQQNTPHQQRSSTPSSPSLRGRQPQANPNFVPPASNISTRLPTPVRINASPGPSPSSNSIALIIPKPPSPSRSLSQSGAAPLANPFASTSACSSPAASASTINTFTLPTPPSILTNNNSLLPLRSTQQAASRGGGAMGSSVPWASASFASLQGQGANSATPTSVRPSPPPQERSILASVQLPANQQQHHIHRGVGGSSNVIGAFTAAIPGHSENLAPVAAPAPKLAGAGGSASAVAGVSPVLNAPAIQAALQQALQGAVERKPETFGRVVDNFERFFDSLMHPGDPGKLDGPLPHELPEELRYGDGWYRHCRERRNGFNQPGTPCSAPAAAVAGPESTPIARRFTSTPFAEPLNDAAPQQDQAAQQPLQKPVWTLEEPPMSDACAKALEVAHHGLRKVLTPTARSRSASDMTAGASAAVQRSAAPSLLELAQQRLQLLAQPGASVTAAAASEGDLDDTAASRPQPVAASPEVAQTASAQTTALESLARDQGATAVDMVETTGNSKLASSPQRCLVPALDLASCNVATKPPAVTTSEAAAVVAEVELDAELTGAPDGELVAAAAGECLEDLEVSSSPVRITTRPPVGSRRFKVPALLIRSLDAPLRPNAAGAALSPPPDSARPPSTAATTPGPKTPGGGGGGIADSTATTAATTPVGRGSATALTTPRTTTAHASTTSSAFESALPLPTVSATTHEPQDAGPCMAAPVESTGPHASAGPAPLRSLSRELAAVDRIADAALLSSVLQSGPTPATEIVAAAAVEADAPPMPAMLWSPAFPPVAPAAVMARGAVAMAGTVPQQRPPSPVTLLQYAPRDMPTPNPAFFSSAAAPAAGPSSLAAAVAAVAAPGQAATSAGAGAHSAEGPSTSKAPASVTDPLKEIVVGIEKLSTLKQNILAEDKEVDVASITQMIQLKLAVEQLLARTSTAMQDTSATSHQPAAAAAAAAERSQVVANATSAAATVAPQAFQTEQAATAATPKKHSRSASFGAFLKSVFSPRSGSASKAQQASAAASAAAQQASSSASGKQVAQIGAATCLNTAASSAIKALPASPAATVVGVRAARPMSASALPRSAASPSLTDRSRYAALHQRAAARLAEAAAEPAGARASPAVTRPPSHTAHVKGQRGDIWQRYEEKIAIHRQQLDTTKSQLDEAVRKLNDMQVEFDELLLCLGMESAKNKALCEAMRAAGLDPEPILAAIEEQWMNGTFQ